ncbi:MAG: HNH endonuclease [Gammaproteobacteria bacterium]|nr:HNH endonuclease [Gammaproteobacteria bacterium]
MEYLLSVRTAISKGKIWYADQIETHDQIYNSEEGIDYSFMRKNGKEGAHFAQNQWLLSAYKKQIPIIYFLAVAPGRYEAIIPTFIGGWDPDLYKARLIFGLPLRNSLTDIDVIDTGVLADDPSFSNERKYALRTVKQRLHQASFREALIHAYDGRCAISNLPEPKLIDAAHIYPDANEEFGQPIVSNGLPLSKIHHAAFDSDLIGIDPEFRVHVSRRLISRRDGPLLDAIKRIEGQRLHLPKQKVHWPDPSRLESRFDQFKAANN